MIGSGMEASNPILNSLDEDGELQSMVEDGSDKTRVEEKERAQDGKDHGFMVKAEEVAKLKGSGDSFNDQRMEMSGENTTARNRNRTPYAPIKRVKRDAVQWDEDIFGEESEDSEDGSNDSDGDEKYDRILFDSESDRLKSIGALRGALHTTENKRADFFALKDGSHVEVLGFTVGNLFIFIVLCWFDYCYPRNITNTRGQLA